MILYATKQTRERFKLKLPEEMSDQMLGAAVRAVIEDEQGDDLLEWGAKLFYFDRRKCIQVANFASKLTFFLADIKLDDLSGVGNLIAEYMLDLYSDSHEMQALLKRLFDEHPLVAFSSLTDKSMIATLNHTQRVYLEDGYTLYRYISDGILHTRKINRDVNRDWCFTRKENGRVIYFSSAERFEELLRVRFNK